MLLAGQELLHISDQLNLFSVNSVAKVFLYRSILGLGLGFSLLSLERSNGARIENKTFIFSSLELELGTSDVHWSKSIT